MIRNRLIGIAARRSQLSARAQAEREALGLRGLLREAITGEGNFYELGGTGDVLAVGAVLQPTTQTS